MSPLHYRHLRTFFLLEALMLGTFLLRPGEALADPHATFFTDRAQEQLFYNVLAALNQADFVEPPDQPAIASNRRIGEFIRTGIYTAPPPPLSTPTVSTDSQGRVTVVSADPLEPSEATGVELPRIRVRQVTSDDGDVYFRERVERRARSEEMRVLLGVIGCRITEQIFGPDAAQKSQYCPDINEGVSPGLLPFLSPG